MRSILSWLLFAGQNLIPFEEKNPQPPVPIPGFDNSFLGSEAIVVMRYPLPGPAVFVTVMPIFFVILGATCHYWTSNIEPYFGIITRRAEDIMFGKETRPATLPTRHD